MFHKVQIVNLDLSKIPEVKICIPVSVQCEDGEELLAWLSGH